MVHDELSKKEKKNCNPTYAEYTSWSIARPRIENVEIS